MRHKTRATIRKHHEFTQAVSPALSTLAVNKTLLGVTAAGRLMHMIERRDPSTLKIGVDVELVQRESVRML